MEDPSLQMPDLQLPVEDAGEEKEYQPVPNEEPEIRFEEKSWRRDFTGNDTFKKRQVKSGDQTKRQTPGIESLTQLRLDVSAD